MDLTGTRLYDIPYYYQTVPTLSKALTSSILFLLLYLGRTTNLRSVPFGNPLHLFVQDHQGPLLHFLEPSQLKKLVEGSADTTTVSVDTLLEGPADTTTVSVDTLLEGSADTTTVTVDTLLEAFLNIPELCLFHCSSFLSGKKQNFWFWDFCHEVPV